jgi:ABC-type polysaccharide/polyol phosphate export permease
MTPAPVHTLRSRVSRAWEALAALTLGGIREDRDFTPIGVLKWVIEPLLFTVVYFVLLVAVIGRTGNRPLLFLLCALLPYRYFSGVAAGSLNLIGRHSSILTNRSFPRGVLPLVLMGTEGVTFAISLVFLAPLMALYGVAPTLALAWLPAILLVLGTLTSGVAYLGSVVGLYFPDLRGLIQNLIRIVFFISTALVRGRGGAAPGETLPELLKANPLSGIFDSVRAVVITGRPPATRDLVYPLAVGLVLLGFGIIVYRWREPQFAKEV